MIIAKRERLLDAYLAATISKDEYQRKTDEMQIELAEVREKLGSETKINDCNVDMAEKVFDLTQRAAETWLRSNSEVRRELLDVLCLNRVLDDASLCFELRKPFDALAQQPVFEKNTGDWI